jgi:hypothetical protein
MENAWAQGGKKPFQIGQKLNFLTPASEDGTISKKGEDFAFFRLKMTLPLKIASIYQHLANIVQKCLIKP